MHYGAIKKFDIANGEGIRTSLFVSGCRNRCKNCFQPETWAFDYGDPFTPEVAEEIYNTFNNPFLAGLTVLGGEPMEPRISDDCRREYLKAKRALELLDIVGLPDKANAYPAQLSGGHRGEWGNLWE